MIGIPPLNLSPLWETLFQGAPNTHLSPPYLNVLGVAFLGARKLPFPGSSMEIFYTKVFPLFGLTLFFTGFPFRGARVVFFFEIAPSVDHVPGLFFAFSGPLGGFFFCYISVKLVVFFPPQINPLF